MKKILYTLSCILLLSTASYAQDDRGNGDRIRERMTEYLQERLNLSKNEAERFSPVFMQYFNELRNTNQQYRGDRLVLQQKIVDLRLRYRDQFKNIMGEKRSNDVFTYEREFVNEVKEIQKQRLQNRGNRRGQ
jgi:hypothetical protein